MGRLRCGGVHVRGTGGVVYFYFDGVYEEDARNSYSVLNMNAAVGYPPPFKIYCERSVAMMDRLRDKRTHVGMYDATCSMLPLTTLAGA
jgi:hypothetical protein